jgi:adenylate kinase family enzyme
VPPPAPTPQRIQIIGPSCAGKTTLGRELGARLRLPVTDLDEWWWSPGWVGCGHPALRERLAPLAASPGWIVSGNYFASTEPVLRPRVQWLIVLDFPLGLVTLRALRRTLVRGITGEPCCNGNRELVTRLFHRDGVIRYTWRHWARRHAYYQTLASDPALTAARVTLLQGPADVVALLRTLPSIPEDDSPLDSNAPEAA